MLIDTASSSVDEAMKGPLSFPVKLTVEELIINSCHICFPLVNNLGSQHNYHNVGLLYNKLKLMKVHAA